MAPRIVDRLITCAHCARPKVNSSFQQARTRLVLQSCLQTPENQTMLGSLHISLVLPYVQLCYVQQFIRMNVLQKCFGNRHILAYYKYFKKQKEIIDYGKPFWVICDMALINSLVRYQKQGFKFYKFTLAFDLALVSVTTVTSDIVATLLPAIFYFILQNREYCIVFMHFKVFIKN